MEVIGERGESGSVTTPHLNETLLVLAMSGEEGQGAGGGGETGKTSVVFLYSLMKSTSCMSRA